MAVAYEFGCLAHGKPPIDKGRQYDRYSERATDTDNEVVVVYGVGYLRTYGQGCGQSERDLHVAQPNFDQSPQRKAVSACCKYREEYPIPLLPGKPESGKVAPCQTCKPGDNDA